METTNESGQPITTSEPVRARAGGRGWCKGVQQAEEGLEGRSLVVYSFIRQWLAGSLLCVRDGVQETAHFPVGVRCKEQISQDSAVSVAVSMT